MRYCTISSCSKKHYGNGYCQQHNQHVRRHGKVIETKYVLHGLTNHKLFKAYTTMKQRCYNPSATGYHNYGGRGIRVCTRWLDNFENFVADMGDRPEGTTLDRKDTNGDYTPENCQWATYLQQSLNRRSKVGKYGYKGVSKNRVGGKFSCQFSIDNKNYRIGSFDTPEEAAHIYEEVFNQLYIETNVVATL